MIAHRSQASAALLIYLLSLHLTCPIDNQSDTAIASGFFPINHYIMTLGHTYIDNDLNVLEVEVEIALHNNTSHCEKNFDLEDDNIPYVEEDKERRSSNQTGSLLNKCNVTAAILLGLCVVGFGTVIAATSSNASADGQAQVSELTNIKSSKAPKAKAPKSANKNTSTSPSMYPSTQPSEQPSSYCSTRVEDFKNLLLSTSVSESDAINDESSPQGKALYWLACEDCIDPPLQPGDNDAQIIQR